MATKLAKRLLLADSPIGMTEAFVKAMDERVNAIMEGLKVEISHRILFEGYESFMDAAIDYVMQQAREKGIESLSSSISEAAEIFSVSSSDLQNIFEDAVKDDPETVISEQVKYADFQKSTLQRLDNIIENSTGDIIGFSDMTSAYVTPEEGRALLEVYSSLNTDNRKKMVEKLVSSKKEFNKLIEFASEVIGD